MLNNIPNLRQPKNFPRLALPFADIGLEQVRFDLDLKLVRVGDGRSEPRPDHFENSRIGATP